VDGSELELLDFFELEEVLEPDDELESSEVEDELELEVELELLELEESESLEEESESDSSDPSFLSDDPSPLPRVSVIAVPFPTTFDLDSESLESLESLDSEFDFGDRAFF
jgi:hypothetical protein